MNKYLTLTLFVFFALTAKSQQFCFELGKVISKFDYKNSKGVPLDNMHGSTDYHLALDVKLPIKRSNFSFVTGIWYNKYGANASDETVGNYYDWKVNYLGLILGSSYEFFKLNSHVNYKNTNDDEGFTFFVQFNTGTEMMVQGTQTINKQVYKLNGVEQFDKPLIFAQGGIGVNYYISNTILVFAQYMGGKSFAVFKSNSGDQEKLNLITHTISIGIGVNLPAAK